MNTVTIFAIEGSHLLISGKYRRIRSFRVQTNRISISMVTVVAPYFKFLNQQYISANTPKSNEPAIYLSQRSGGVGHGPKGIMGKKIKNGLFASDLRFVHISRYAIKIPGEIV